ATARARGSRAGSTPVPSWRSRSATPSVQEIGDTGPVGWTGAHSSHLIGAWRDGCSGASGWGRGGGSRAWRGRGWLGGRGAGDERGPGAGTAGGGLGGAPGGTSTPGRRRVVTPGPFPDVARERARPPDREVSLRT